MGRSHSCDVLHFCEHPVLTHLLLKISPLQGLPLFFYLKLSRNRHKLWAHRDSEQRYGMLYMPYKRSKWHAEVVEMARKFLLVGPIIFFKPGTTTLVPFMKFFSFFEVFIEV